MKDLRAIVLNSAFNKQSYEISTPMDILSTFLTRWSLPLDDRTDSRKENKEYSSKECLERIIPAFQRSNDKWTREMQIKFVENIICGAETNIIFGYVATSGTSKCNCKLIDGQQRVTALLDWMDNKFNIFDEVSFSHPDVDVVLSGIYDFKTRIYRFDTEQDMVQFYIDMNENITHSSEDIDKAKQYLKALK